MNLSCTISNIAYIESVLSQCMHNHKQMYLHVDPYSSSQKKKKKMAKKLLPVVAHAEILRRIPLLQCYPQSPTAPITGPFPHAVTPLLTSIKRRQMGFHFAAIRKPNLLSHLQPQASSTLNR